MGEKDDERRRSSYSLQLSEQEELINQLRGEKNDDLKPKVSALETKARKTRLKNR